MAQKATIGGVLALAALFGWGVPLLRLFEAFQPMIVALSIMVAAILVRLNRGMPTLDWKSLEPVERARLTSSIVSLTQEYVIIIGIEATLLASLVALTVVKDEVKYWDIWTTRGVSAGIGALIALSIARMGYVIWRDYDIVRLQKKLIDASGAREKLEADLKASSEKIASIRSAGLRKTGSSDPKPWPDE
ncbi:hypothetical protein [Azospirillum sp. TSO22-1]|uniref:hypothetical protein n=1 Tax=Azospirillum sp. TSO22-1 TaxID=716789 RepID=UPI000D6173DA|nr:hypothetical protein [Azospirillum sp. TSO22-1]PWC36763.1 hypothetical protein TSO221_28950 [Azospirillum sp. TSO22-1]